MKKSFRNLLFGAAALSMALAVGAGLGLADKKEVKPVEAWSGSECGTTWYAIGTINGQNWNQWNAFTLNSSRNRYEYAFTSTTQAEFKLKNVNSWDGGIEINAGYGSDLDWSGKGWTDLTTNNGGNFKMKDAGSYIIYFDKNITSYGNGVWAFGIEKNDYPSDEGYYVVGSATNWEFDDDLIMYFNDDYSPLDTDGNIAVYYGYEAAANEEIKIRSYINGVRQWYGYNNTDNNYKFASAGSYDIFYKDNTFYVSEHHERHIVTVTHVLFDGKTQTGTEQGVDELATEGEVFNPTALTKSGYAFRGYFTDANCTTAYTPAQPTADFPLYAKFTRSCYYLFGDDAFLGTGHGWNVDYASPVSAGTGDNRLEGVAVIPNTASAQNPVCIKPLLYDTNGQMVAETYTLGEERAFVSLDNNGNFAFSEGGTYAFYVNNQNKVYFNIGEYVFHTKFLTEVGGVCNAQGKTVIANLQSVWAEQKSAYNALSAADKKNITDVGFNGGDEHSSDDRLKMIAKYHYIVTKYGTSVVEDFIWNQTIAASQSNNSKLLFGNDSSTEATVIIVTVTTLAAIAVGGYFLLKKKRA